MLLIPVAENAFKHHSGKHNQEGIVINIVIGQNELRLASSNAYDPGAKKSESSGLGLQTLKRRLDLLYAKKYKMEIRPSSSTFNIELIIPLSN
jgi:LytS/YehU family sensor histidine kinase